MATTVTSILTNVSSLLQDTTNVRWTLAQLTVWLNDGQREIAVLKPNAYIKNSTVQLAAGTKQVVPSDGIYLIDIPRYLGTDGSTPSYAIKSISREILDNQVPDWHATKYANARPKHFIYDELDPKRFYVYPPQPSSGFGYVDVIYGAIPPDAATNITLPDEYSPALVNYILYRAWTQDSEWANNQALAANYYDKFMTLLMGKAKGESDSSPNKALGPMESQGGKK